VFVANAWYAAAWAEDVGRKFVPRVILGQPVILYRKGDGAPVALENRCAHRRMALSEGNLIGDDVQCMYHGLMYRPDGACFHVPGQSRVPPGMGVRSYPCAERHALVWLWPGDPARADPARIPRFDWLDDPARGKTGRYMRVAANYQLIVDNLLDLSHLAYVHTKTVGNTAVGEQAAVTTDVYPDDSIRVMRWMVDVPPASTYGQFGAYTTNIDRWQISLWRPPSYFWVDNGSCATGTGRHAREPPRRQDLGLPGVPRDHARDADVDALLLQGHQRVPADRYGVARLGPAGQLGDRRGRRRLRGAAADHRPRPGRSERRDQRRQGPDRRPPDRRPDDCRGEPPRGGRVAKGDVRPAGSV
jgi:phenylpropionate dioxygenase-like ring-hydroxylating dioxygenase large terminal subunit